MSEHPHFDVVTDTPAPKKPFFLNKKYVKTALIASAVTGVAYLAFKIKNGDFEDASVVIDSTADALNITAA